MGGPYGFGGEFQASINKNKLKILIKDTGKENGVMLFQKILIYKRE